MFQREELELEVDGKRKRLPDELPESLSLLHFKIFYFFLVPLACFVPFLVVPQGLRVPQPFPANLLTSFGGKMVSGCAVTRFIYHRWRRIW
jgi:hypothetical protein